MKNIIYTIAYSFLTVLSVSFVMQSCVRDDLSDCVAGKRVYFNYMLADTASVTTNTGDVRVAREGIFPGDVTFFNLYVFDEDGKFVKEVSARPVFVDRDSSRMYLDIDTLETGVYKFLAWANLSGQYSLSNDLVPGVSTAADVEVQLDLIKNSNEVSEELSPLFYASHLDESFTVQALLEQSFDLDLIQDTYKFNVSVTGLDSAYAGEHSFTVDVTDTNGKYKLDNAYSACKQFNYIRDCALRPVEDGKSEAYTPINIMRMDYTRNPHMRLKEKDTNATVLEDNWGDLFLLLRSMTGYNVDWNNQYEFDLRYFLTSSAATIIVEVNGWRLVIDNNGASLNNM